MPLCREALEPPAARCDSATRHGRVKTLPYRVLRGYGFFAARRMTDKWG